MGATIIPRDEGRAASRHPGDEPLLAELVGTLKRLIDEQRALLDRTRQGEPPRRR
ncbi:MAG: hypothetical protein KIT58_20945 [Planctomycetota bacterium]|nr:hypothetical protein [Planctomycetota bacterium]